MTIYSLDELHFLFGTGIWDTLILKFWLSFYSFFEVMLYYGLLSVLPEALVNTLEKSLRGPWVVWKFTQLENLGSNPKSYHTFGGTLAQAGYLSEHLLPRPSDDKRQYVTMGRIWVSGSSLGSKFWVHHLLTFWTSKVTHLESKFYCV